MEINCQCLLFGTDPGADPGASQQVIISQCHVLTPGRHVGAEDIEDGGEAFEVKVARLVAEWNGQFVEFAKLETAIRANLKSLNFNP